MLAALSLQLMRQPTKSSSASTIAVVAVDRLERHRLVVLADDGQQDAAPHQRLQRPLELDERLTVAVVAAEAQRLPADVADDAAPEGVVEVDDDQLARRRRARR